MKTEKVDPDLPMIKPDLNKVKLENKYSIPMPFADGSIYNDDCPALTVLKLPHSFAGKGLSDDPNVKTVFDYPLNAMLDGQIGKICVRRSGKIEVHIGRIKYNLDDLGFSMDSSEVVNIVPKDGGTKEMGLAVLGEVKNWFTLVPDWNKLSSK